MYLHFVLLFIVSRNKNSGIHERSNITSKYSFYRGELCREHLIIIMNISRMYSWIFSIVILFSLSFSQKVEFRELIGALNKIAISTESKKCKSNEECSKIQQCQNGICVDPCPGSCGIDALCYTVNHTHSCECPRCYNGDPEKKCETFTGLRYWSCALSGHQ
ncbi:hypothetical protein PV327_011190 [Microctonus hyperodae]|uniref:EGF-like domain-containing protein n=1 Tax=Microctonus hyperodae TaxID=165561 RepID=A0AA39EUV8_MICHY|nr:hypothetical protein PV327_011190 [Microctonus hyperodae]